MVQYGLGSIRREHASRASRLALETQRSPDVAALDDTQPPRTHALSGDGASWVFGGPGGRILTINLIDDVKKIWPVFKKVDLGSSELAPFYL